MLARGEATGSHLSPGDQGDIAAERIDVAQPTHPTGFLPSERKAFPALLDLGLSDCFRVIHPGEPGHYTWWEYAPRGRGRKLRWRFDFLASPALMRELRECRDEPEPRLSVDCAVVAEFRSRFA